jgi:hypothetical protein
MDWLFDLGREAYVVSADRIGQQWTLVLTAVLAAQVLYFVLGRR